MKKSSSDHSCKPDRKTVERNQRIHMKDILTQQDQIDQAAAYITQLKERIEVLKMRKELVIRNNGVHPNDGDYANSTIHESMFGSNPSPFAPVVDLRVRDSGLDLIGISGEKKNFMLYTVKSLLEEKGAEVVRASVSKVGGKFFHSIHAQERICRLGMETARYRERQQDLACSFAGSTAI